ncbi:MAG: MFS transporter [Alphaproteobacteria bacterium]
MTDTTQDQHTPQPVIDTAEPPVDIPEWALKRVDTSDGAPPLEEQWERYRKMGAGGRFWGRTLSAIKLGPPYVPAADQMKVFWLVGIAIMVNHYDIGIFGLALPRIQESLAISDGEVGMLAAYMRLGILPGLFLALFADRMGRRKLLMLTILGTATFTFLTAFATTKETFVALQFLARACAYTEDILCFVVVVEVMDPKLRGWAIGALGALGAAGHGLAAGVYANIEIIPYDWRGLYMLGVGPMLLLAWLRRGLDETDRFKNQQDRREEQAQGGKLLAAFKPLVSVVTAYPGRMIAICAVIAPFAFGAGAALWFVPKYLQTELGWSVGAASTMYIVGGTLAVAGNFLAGRLSDQVGRKSILITGLLVSAVGMGLFYSGIDGWLVVVVWVTAQFAFFCAEVTLSALGGELFPTSYRSTASSVRAIVSSLAAVAGLLTQSALYAMTGDFGLATAIPLALIPLSAIIAWFAIPETATKTLEDISPEVD